jgi:hypothetical protein
MTQMEAPSSRAKETFVRKLIKMGVEESYVPRVLKDISLIFGDNSSIGFQELTHRLQLLGWSEIQINHRLLELAKATVPVEDTEI